MNETLEEHVNRFDINSPEFDTKTKTFLCYYFLKTNQKWEETETFLKSYLAKLNGLKTPPWESVFWLWLLGEALNSKGELQNWSLYETQINKVVTLIGNDWKPPKQHWLASDQVGIFLSNIAIGYGAIQTINNSLRNENFQQYLQEMREYLFEKFLVKGTVISKLGTKDPFGDIGVCAIPFALLNAGDQILVSAIRQIEETLVSKGVRFSQDDIYYGGCTRPDLTCLLAWYYSEVGNIPQAKWLLSQVEDQWQRNQILYEVDPTTYKEAPYYDYTVQKEGPPTKSDLSYILYAISKNNLFSKDGFTGAFSAEQVAIIHKPLGNGSPYSNDNIERVPRHPEEGEFVIIRMRTEPLYDECNADIEVIVNGVHKTIESMELCTSEEGEKYWQAPLGRFEKEHQVSYRFIVKVTGKEIISNDYHFKPRFWSSLNKIVEVQQKESDTTLFFEGINGSNKLPTLQIIHSPTIQFLFRLTESSSNVHLNNDTAFSPAKDQTVIQLGEMQLLIDLSTIQISLFQGQHQKIFSSYHNSQGFLEILTDTTGQVYKLRLKLDLAPNEKIFGMGERFMELEFRGKTVDNYVFNQYKDQGLRTYLPTPLSISSQGYGLFLDTSLYSIFKFGSRLVDLFEIEMDFHPTKQDITVHFFPGTPANVLESYTKLTGKPKLPPKWAFGPWMSSNNWDSQTETLRQLELTLKHKIPATVLVLEQWSDEATFYIFNDAQYTPKSGLNAFKLDDFHFPEWGRWPNPQDMVATLHQKGIKVLLWQIPVVKFMEGTSHKQKDEDERMMLDRGFMVKHKNGNPYRIPPFEWFKGSLIPDFSNPEAHQWWFDKRKYLLKEIGIDGFKTDGGECIYGNDLVFFDGRNGEEMRNQYPNEYIKSYYDFVQSHKNGITFSRAGYSGAQNFPLHWAGDERSTFEAFQHSIIAGLSSGMSGIPFWGWDLGGFHGDIPSAELYIRATQMATFCPVMQYHAETKGEFNQDRTPWNIAERTGHKEVLTIFKTYADLRMNLLPYIYHQAIQSSQSGTPLMRSMFFQFPQDDRCHQMKDQYMFGDAFLVAPIAQKDHYSKEIYFPEGQWLHLFNGHVVSGPRIQNEKADLHEIPVYLKENTLVPLNLSKNLKLCSDVGNRLESYQKLCFMVFLTDQSNLEFSDDRGLTLKIDMFKNHETITIKVSGNQPIPIYFILRNLSHCKTVTMDGKVSDLKDIPDELDMQCHCFYKNSLYIQTTSNIQTINLYS